MAICQRSLWRVCASIIFCVFCFCSTARALEVLDYTDTSNSVKTGHIAFGIINRDTYYELQFIKCRPGNERDEKYIETHHKVFDKKIFSFDDGYGIVDKIFVNPPFKSVKSKIDYSSAMSFISSKVGHGPLDASDVRMKTLRNYVNGIISEAGKDEFVSCFR